MMETMRMLTTSFGISSKRHEKKSICLREDGNENFHICFVLLIFKKNYNLDWILKIGNRKYEIERLCFTFKLSFQKLKFIVSANINSL